MTPRRRAALVGTITVTLLGLAGCGGSPSAQATADPTVPPVDRAPALASEAASAPAADPAVESASGSPTRKAFLREGNAVCAQGSAGLVGIGEAVPADDEAALLAAIADQVVPNVRNQMSGLRALGYPPGDRRRLSGILEDTDAVLEEWASDPAVAFTDTRMDAINDRLYDYGLTSCGES